MKYTIDYLVTIRGHLAIEADESPTYESALAHAESAFYTTHAPDLTLPSAITIEHIQDYPENPGAIGTSTEGASTMTDDIAWSWDGETFYSWQETERQFGHVSDVLKRYALLWSLCPVCETSMRFIDGIQTCTKCGWSERMLVINPSPPRTPVEPSQ